ncbi:MAG: hypothetical protein IID44_06530 [Planctomycetes bacterium]|nr:hypothetical protein [Planctomycetota bacterium]
MPQRDENEENLNRKKTTPPGDEVNPPTHPICQGAPDPTKCEEYVERLSEASDNIDRKS